MALRTAGFRFLGATLCALLAACGAEVAKESTVDANRDMDGDGIPDTQDPDIDGDGILNADDPNPYSAGGAGGAGGRTGMAFGGNGFGSGGGSTRPTEECLSRDFSAEPMPVDMFVMFDQSSSMNDCFDGPSLQFGFCDPAGGGTSTWWQVAVGAMKGFVSDARANGIGVGIQYFPLNGVEPASCTAPYSTADVPIQLLPGAAGAIHASLDAHGNSTFTPTGPALQGAIDHLKAWAAMPQNAGRAPVVIFVTDGYPTECQPRDVGAIADLAAAALAATPSVRTFVIGFETGGGLANLDQIAERGGTGKAFLISGGDVDAQLVTALLGIASTPLQCEYEMPPPPDGTVLVPSEVQVHYHDAARNTDTEIPALQNASECVNFEDQGWYYDHPTSPTTISVCAGTCSQFAAGTLSLKFGCAPTVGTGIM